MVPTPLCPPGTTGTYPNCIVPQPVQPITNNTCTNNSCNTNINDNSNNSINITGSFNQQLPPPPPPTYHQPVYQPTYTPIYNNPAPQPYSRVSLSQIPYTGLDLGPVGTVLYWMFLVLWCAGAAYLIAVKKIHKSFLTKVRNFIYGDDSVATHPAYTESVADRVIENAKARGFTPASANGAPGSGDDFILSQLGRHK